MADTEFEGFANAPVDKKGQVVDFRDVKPFVDKSEEGKVRAKSQTTPSSITKFSTKDTSTDGAPAASVGVFGTTEKPQDADAAEGQEANGS